MDPDPPLGWTVRLAPLPSGVLGDICWLSRTITVDSRLPAAVRRCTVAHEVEHAMRGPASENPVLAAREERAVEKAAARRLIGLRDLAEAMAESDDLVYVAERLDVDPAMLRVRLEDLSPGEVETLAADRLESAIP